MILTLLSVIGFLIYSNVVRAGFVFDDLEVIVENPAIRNLTDFGAIFESFNTRLIPGLSFAANYAFGGLDPLGYHAVNIALHILTAFLVYQLVNLTLCTPVLEKFDPYDKKNFSLCCALIFLTHPVQTQAVSYIWQRTAVMAAFFYIGSLIFYVEHRLRPHWAKFSASVACAALGMFSKETVATLPMAVVLYEFFFFGDGYKRFTDIAKRAVPFFVLSLIIPILLTHSKPGTLELMKPGVDTTISNLLTKGWQNSSSFPIYFLTQWRVFATYFGLLLVPVNQNIDYDLKPSSSFLEPETFLAFSLSALILTLAVYLFKKNRLISFGICWFFLTLSIESLIPLPDFIFEHRLYLPMFGFSVVLTTVIFLAVKSAKKLLFKWIMVMLIISYALLTYGRNSVWQNGLSLWSDAIQKSPLKARPYNNRGLFYEEAGFLKEALIDYDRAIALNPRYADAYANRGNISKKHRNLEKALADYNKAIELSPKGPKSFYNRGIVHKEMGQLDHAIEDYEKSIRLHPYAEAYNNLSIAYAIKKKFPEAIAASEQAIRLNGKSAESFYNRGMIHQMKNESDEALRFYKKALEINPSHAKALFESGNIHRSRNFWPQAIADYQKAIKADPRFAEAYNNLAFTYALSGFIDDALLACQNAIDINPDYAEAYSNRGLLYHTKNKIEEAIMDYDKALSLDPNLSDAYFNRGNAHASMQSFEKAIADYTKTIELNSGHRNAHLNRGNVYQVIGLLDKSLLDYQKVIELDPSSGEAYFNRATALLKSDPKKSWQDAHEAKKRGFAVKKDFFLKIRDELRSNDGPDQ